jgi:hypothetical protein
MMAKTGFIALAAMLIATGAKAKQDTVVIDDTPPPPQTANQSYSGICANGRSYTLDVSWARDGRARLSVRDGNKVVPISVPTILAQITRADLYAVHIHCGPRAAGFETDVLKPGGQKVTQTIGISDRAGVAVYPAQTSEHSG